MMKQKPLRKKQTVALTEAERAARRRAEDALRAGLPVCSKTRRHLAAARRKLNLQRYGNADAFTPPAVATEGGATHYH
jgi:hypothetical protein